MGSAAYALAKKAPLPKNFGKSQRISDSKNSNSKTDNIDTKHNNSSSKSGNYYNEQTEKIQDFKKELKRWKIRLINSILILKNRLESII